MTADATILGMTTRSTKSACNGRMSRIRATDPESRSLRVQMKKDRTLAVMRSTNEYAAKCGGMQESAILELSPGHLARWRRVPDQGTLDLNRRGRRVMACRRAVDAPHGNLTGGRMGLALNPAEHQA